MRKRVALLCFIGLSLQSIYAQEWLTNIIEAKKTAKEQNKKIIIVFQGSDWCIPCVKLEKEVWSTEIFQKYATSHFVMLKADFPRKQKKISKEQKEHNNLLAEKYNPKGYFPWVIVMNKEGNVLGTTGYKKKTPEEYILSLIHI